MCDHEALAIVRSEQFVVTVITVTGIERGKTHSKPNGLYLPVRLWLVNGRENVGMNHLFKPNQRPYHSLDDLLDVGITSIFSMNKRVGFLFTFKRLFYCV